jgi:SHS2 domain-containing protein
MKIYQTFNHTADLGLVIRGKTEEDLFANAALSVFEIITDLHKVEPLQTRLIAVDGNSREDILINFLREMLYLYNGERWLLKEIKIRELTEEVLAAEVRGEPFEKNKHEICKEIKAVTYHQLRIRKGAAGWRARVIFDV